MSTTRRDASPLAGSAQVVALRPRLMARRAAGLHRRLGARLATGPIEHQRALEVITEVLARGPRVPPVDHDAWERLLDLLEEHEHTTHVVPACAATANLLGLALFGETEDHLALADLAERLGHQRLARMQHRYGATLESDSRLPVTSDALRRMLLPDLRERLLSDPETADRVETIEDACMRAAHALLVQGVDRAWTVPRLDSVEELLDMTRLGTVVEWRHHFAMVLANAWSPYTERMVELAEEAGDAHTATVIASLIDLCREQVASARAGPTRWPRRADASTPAARVRHRDGRAVP
jgi:hypothetical protein